MNSTKPFSLARWAVTVTVATSIALLTYSPPGCYADTSGPAVAASASAPLQLTDFTTQINTGGAEKPEWIIQVVCGCLLLAGGIYAGVTLHQWCKKNLTGFTTNTVTTTNFYEGPPMQQVITTTTTVTDNSTGDQTVTTTTVTTTLSGSGPPTVTTNTTITANTATLILCLQTNSSLSASTWGDSPYKLACKYDYSTMLATSAVLSKDDVPVSTNTPQVVSSPSGCGCGSSGPASLVDISAAIPPIDKTVQQMFFRWATR